MKIPLTKIGTILIFSGIAIFVLGASTFKFIKPNTPFIEMLILLGMYCFLLWIPVTIIGVVLFIIGLIWQKRGNLNT
ncbi:MAG: hypothetical protein EOP46_06945 [Sphingobacteriaceae bacterium]|nr:MAG: hypothetical protein EOP46_06945 [Sphingobacteriaceae bacterium]